MKRTTISLMLISLQQCKGSLISSSNVVLGKFCKLLIVRAKVWQFYSCLFKRTSKVIVTMVISYSWISVIRKKKVIVFYGGWLFRSGSFMPFIFFVIIYLISGLRTGNKRNLDTIRIAVCCYGATTVGILLQLNWFNGLWRFS